MNRCTPTGVVVIGRNEGPRLQRCLRSVVPVASDVVYVDSGSSDGSVGFAHSLGVATVELDMSRPFTAARARNEGFSRLLEIAPQTELVLFIDGDCELDAAWLSTVDDVFAGRPEVAIVTGRLRERNPQASWYNRLCEIEWDGPVGEVTECGGIFTARVDHFAAVHGFDASLIAGEEPELCLRLRRSGAKIIRIAADMAWHDADMTRFDQWWRRTIRNGYAFAQGFAMYGWAPERFRLRETVRCWFWGFLLPLAIVVMAVFVSPWWLSTTVVYPLMVIKIARQRLVRGDALRESLLFGCFMMVSKFAECWGQLRFWLLRALGLQTRIIEYKRAPSV